MAIPRVACQGMEHCPWVTTGPSADFDQIASGSRTIFNFADAYGRCAAEEQGPGSHPMPTRLPSEREIGDMLNMAEWMRGMLDNLRTMVQQSVVMNDRAREASRGKGSYEDEDMAMYGDGMKSAYEMAGVKKRRGVSERGPLTRTGT